MPINQLAFRIVYTIKESADVFSNNYEATSLPKKKYTSAIVSTSFYQSYTQIFIYYVEAAWLLGWLENYGKMHGMHLRRMYFCLVDVCRGRKRDKWAPLHIRNAAAIKRSSETFNRGRLF